ncbi:MAG: NAD-dependent epimerase/dehydratase family protein [Thermodesulfovibrionia bacterium]|nr:NAD-dependent epimerase/dehydratase family protein [Thermodesulfovibrionia bacterium]
MSSGNILITGAGGFIGGGLFEKLKHYNPVGVAFHLTEDVADKGFIEADLRDEKKVKEIFDQYNPATVYHFAAFLSPKRNEENPKYAIESNVGITQNIVNNLSDDAHIIFPSTDKVFDGFDPNPDEEAEVKPVWLYADLKCQCEEIIKKRTDKFHIVRLPIVHALGNITSISTRTGRGSFIDKAIIDLRVGKEVTVFKNVERCFLRIEELLDLFEIFIQDTNYGTYHVGTKMMNYYDRICALCDELEMDWKDKIIPIEGDAKPLAQNLNTDKLNNIFGIVLT